MVDLYRGALTPRRAAVLALALPPGALVWERLGSDAAWSSETHMLALAVDVLLMANWQRSQGKSPKPDPIQRPSDASREKSRKHRALEAARAFRARQVTGPSGTAEGS